MALEAARRTATGMACAGGVLALSIVGIAVGVRDGRIHGAAAQHSRLQLAKILATWRTQPDSALAELFPDPAYVRALAPQMEQRGLSVFRQ